jgi:hypothetical protein
MPQKTSSFILPLLDFERVFRTVHGILLNENCDPLKACLFFGTIGASILNTHYKLNAIPVVGVVTYNLGENASLAFADFEGATLQSSKSGFHCWVEVENHFIDFSSPLFPEILKSKRLPHKCGRKMFQKQLTRVSRTPLEYEAKGSFFCQANATLSEQLIHEFLATPIYADLIKIGTEWYRQPPKKMISTIGIANKYGVAKPVSLSSIRVEGVWL